MNCNNFIKNIYTILFIVTLTTINNQAIGQDHIVPLYAETTAGSFAISTGIELIYDQATGVSNPLTDAYMGTCYVGTTQAYISSYDKTKGTITVGIPTSTIDALHIWSGWATACELDHSLKNVTMSFYSVGVLVATEVLEIPKPDGSGLGFVVPFASIHTDIDKVTIEVNTLHGGNEIGIIELGFHPVILKCDLLTTSVSKSDICIGEKVTLSAVSKNGGIISWDGGVVNGVAFEPPLGTTTYTALSDFDGDCEFTVEITVHALPDIIALGYPVEICLGQSLLLGGSGGKTYEWDYGVINEKPYKPLTIGVTTYTVIGTNEFGCKNSDQIDILVNAPPIADFEFVVDGVSSKAGNKGGCILNPVQFNDLSTSIDPDLIIKWNWSFGDGKTSTEENPSHTYASTGKYTITLKVTTEGGCTASYSFDIIMTDGLSIDFLSNEPTCFGFSDGSITINVFGGLDGLIFEIKNKAGKLLNKDNSNTANALPTGWYYFNVSDGSACDAEDSLFLGQPNEIELNLTRKNPSCYAIEDGWVRVDSVLNATGSYGGISYSWNPNPADIGGVSADSSFNMGAGDYTLTVNDENGCTQIADFKLTQPDSLFFNQFDYDPAYCRIADYQSGNGVVFGSATGGVSPYTYLWTELATGATHPNTTWGGRNPGEYKLVVTDANGCVHDRIIKVDSLNPIAGFEMTSPEFTSNYKGTAPVNVHFVNTSIYYYNPITPSGEPTFFWNFDTVNAPWILTHNVLDAFDTTYHSRGQTYEVEVCLVAINKNGCKDTTCKKITIYEPIVFTPINVFTPNNDGVNDLFSFEYRAASIKQFRCIIVNRWGVTVHEMNAITDSWDGTDSNGTSCKDGTYFYSYYALTDNGTKLEGQGSVQLIGGK